MRVRISMYVCGSHPQKYKGKQPLHKNWSKLTILSLLVKIHSDKKLLNQSGESMLVVLYRKVLVK